MQDQTTGVAPAYADALRLIGIVEADSSDPIHRRLVEALRPVVNGSDGAKLTAMRYVFAWELRDAGAAFATAKAEHAVHLDRETVRLRATPSPVSGKVPTRAEAEQIVRASDEAYTLHVRFLLAEQTERFCRRMLDAIDGAFENHRTDRADARKADFAHAGGYSGGAA